MCLDYLLIQFFLQLLMKGEPETAIIGYTEADLHKHLVGCRKNPGHKQFIPIRLFDKYDLPERFQDIDLVNAVKAVADLTVRVDVKITSPERPEFWPHTRARYPFYDVKGQTIWRTGTGRVRSVHKLINGVNQYGGRNSEYTECWCEKCKTSGSPTKEWWEIFVCTANHVVYDEIEVEQSSLKLFYDGDEAPTVIQDLRIHDQSCEGDWCQLMFVTCDICLGNKLEDMWRTWRDVCWIVEKKFRRLRIDDMMTFIVSHPHGCTKQVSLGQVKEAYQVKGSLLRRHKMLYTTCTCPGSSGATVQCLGLSWGWWLLYQFVHCGSLQSSGLNYSSSGILELA